MWKMTDTENHRSLSGQAAKSASNSVLLLSARPQTHMLFCQSSRFHILTADCLPGAAHRIFFSLPFSFLPYVFCKRGKPGDVSRPVILHYPL